MSGSEQPFNDSVLYDIPHRQSAEEHDRAIRDQLAKLCIRLTKRQRKILLMMRQESQIEIAKKLGFSMRTIEREVRKIRDIAAEL